MPDIGSYKTVFTHLSDKRPDEIAVISTEKPVDISPVAYIPQIFGTIIARLLHFGWIPLIMMGRLFNLIFFIILIYWAIKIIPIGKMVIFSIALLPMSMELASSFSYDSVIISLCVFFTAYVFYLAYEKNK